MCTDLNQSGKSKIATICYSPLSGLSQFSTVIFSCRQQNIKKEFKQSKKYSIT